jgi:hypothetical protein
VHASACGTSRQLAAVPKFGRDWSKADDPRVETVNRPAGHKINVALRALQHRAGLVRNCTIATRRYSFRKGTSSGAFCAGGRSRMARLRSRKNFRRARETIHCRQLRLSLTLVWWPRGCRGGLVLRSHRLRHQGGDLMSTPTYRTSTGQVLLFARAANAAALIAH